MTSSFFSFPLIFCFSRIFSFTIRYILVDEVTLFLNLKSITFHRLTHTQFHYTISTINTKQIGNDEGNDKSYDSYASDDTSESEFDEFELSDEDVEELNPMNESYVTDGGFTSISLKQPDTSFSL